MEPLGKALKEDEAIAEKLNESFPLVFTMEEVREILVPELHFPGCKSIELAQNEVGT